MIESKAVYLMQDFHHQSDYYSESEYCPALYMGDERGTYDNESGLWAPLTDTEAHDYWEKCNCGLKEAVESLIGEEK